MDGLNLKGNSKVSQAQLQTQSDVLNKDIQLKKAIGDLNKQLKPLNLTVRFGYDDKVDFLYVQLIDAQTNRIIKQEPSNHFLKLKETIQNIINNNLKGNEQVNLSYEQQQVVVDEINENLKPINEKVSFKHINNEWVLIENETGKTIMVLDENHIDGLSKKIEEFNDLLGLIFDKKI